LPLLSVRGDVEHALAKNFGYDVPSIDRARSYFLKRIKKDLKKMAASFDHDSSDELIAASLAKRVERSISICIDKLAKSTAQDLELMPLIDSWQMSRNPDDFDKICVFFDAAMKRYVHFANPDVVFDNTQASQLEFMAELIFQRNEVEKAVDSFLRQDENPSPSSYIVDWLFADATRKRRKSISRINNEVLMDDINVLIPETQSNDSLFNPVTLSGRIKESFGISGEAFAELIISIGQRADRGLPLEPAQALEKLLGYECDASFPLEHRVYAIYLRDYKNMGLPSICRIMSNDPFNLKGLTVRKLTDIMNKFRSKVRIGLAAGASKEVFW
jgi:hypothetical protein